LISTEQRKLIETAINQSEQKHLGEIKILVETQLEIADLWRRTTVRERALDAFSQLRLWDTEHNIGVLLYILIAEHGFEIVADRGISEKIPQAEWEQLSTRIKDNFSNNDFGGGILRAVEMVASHLEKHFPRSVVKTNEVSDCVILR